jgi:choline dehydrogenase-like flavoprotein
MASIDTHNIPALCATADEFLKHGYDFVIVGGGIAGLVVAARMTENPSIHVGVLEAGLANIGDPVIMISAMTIRQMGNPQYDWNHKTMPQVRDEWNSDLPNPHNYE